MKSSVWKALTPEKKQRLYLFLILLIVVVGVSAILIYQAYNEHLHDHQREMVHIVKSRARIIEAVAKFDKQYSSNFPGGTREATLSQIRDAHKNFEGFGETGEFSLGELKGESIHFLLRHRHEYGTTSILPPENIAMDSLIATPMQKALKGESGLIIGIDYRGKEVLAAFEPVKELNLGLVAKIDLEEIKGPFIEHGLVALTCGLTIIILGTVAFFKFSDPLITAIRKSEDRYKAMFLKAPLGIAEIDSTTGHIYDVNEQFATIAGRSREDMSRIDWMSITHPDDVQEDLDNVSKLNAGEISGFQMHKRYIRPSGFPVWINMTIAPMRVDELGNPRHLCMIEDISDKKEKELLEGRLDRIMETSIYEIYIFDGNNLNFLKVNSSGVKNLGYSLTELTDMTPLDIKREYNKESFKELLDPIRNGGQDYVYFKTYHQRKDGSAYPVEIRLQYFESENPPVFMATVLDISERKKTEEHINKLSRAIEQSPAVVVITDREGNIEYVNPKFTDSTGYALEEVIGQNPRILKSGETPEAKYKQLWDTILAGNEWKGVFHNKKKDGTLYWENASIAPLKNDDEEITHFIAVKEDITERKKMETTLLDHETFIDSIVDNMHDGLISINRFNKVQLFNARAEKIFGWTSDEIMGKDLTILTPDDYREKHKVGFQNLVETGRSKILDATIEIEGLRKNGESFPLELSVSEMTQGEETWYVAVVRDILERKENEEKLRIAQKQLLASQKLASVGELSAGVSHEVLNPVNIISVQTQMLKRKIKDDERIQLFCDKVGNEIKRIQKIMGGLLEFSREGKTKLEMGTLREHIEKVIDLVEQEFNLDNIIFERKWCDRLVDVKYDPDKMRQVFLNLINNAKQAMPTGGTITISCRPIKVRGRQYHQFSFKDTGIGMNENVATKIFDPFFTTKSEQMGTGMGLSIVHGIIEEHGGEIEIETQEEKGTTLSINLPVAS
ncbi:MAG: PAS domain S-box protein [Nitrospinae bacterium]|nr:PAS domain S-box protein [Nitrospinota bacterium]